MNQLSARVRGETYQLLGLGVSQLQHRSLAPHLSCEGVSQNLYTVLSCTAYHDSSPTFFGDVESLLGR